MTALLIQVATCFFHFNRIRQFMTLYSEFKVFEKIWREVCFKTLKKSTGVSSIEFFIAVKLFLSETPCLYLSKKLLAFLRSVVYQKLQRTNWAFKR